MRSEVVALPGWTVPGQQAEVEDTPDGPHQSLEQLLTRVNDCIERAAAAIEASEWSSAGAANRLLDDTLRDLVAMASPVFADGRQSPASAHALAALKTAFVGHARLVSALEKARTETLEQIRAARTGRDLAVNQLKESALR